MFVGASGNVFIETRHPAYPHLVDFLVSCCEPVSRTEHMEVYRLDGASLSAATAEGTYSTDMIRSVLRYFRLDAQQQLPIDLSRYACLEAWCGSSAAEADPMSYRGLSFMRSPSSAGSSWNEEGELGGTAADVASCESGKVVGSDQTDDKKESEAPAAKLTKMEDTGTGTSARRVLRLGPRIPTPPPQLQQKQLPPVPQPGEPLVALAVTCPASLQPLPAEIAAMLKEEEGACRVRVVLQPRMRRFSQASRLATSLRQYAMGQTEERSSEEGDELHYFIASHDRATLERVVAALKDLLEPIVLHGTERWVISDVERGVEAHHIGETARVATLRKLFSPAGTPTYSTASASGGGGGGGGGGTSSPMNTRGSNSTLIYKSQIQSGKLRNVKERLFKQFGIRADCVYDYLQDPTLTVDSLTLASHVRLRPYQVASLERFRRGNKAHQGVVVLPCGAGKTLTGIGAAATMRKRTIVMCINNMSVFQWKREFIRWTNLTEDEVTVCTAKEKSMPGKVFITTYSMLVAKRDGAAAGASARESEEILRAMTSEPWGLLLLDEVHTALAHHFQEVLNMLKYKCVLGLSATLLREDDKISELRHLVGPKLYEANWLELTRAGFLAKVECAEVQCPLPLKFYAEYVQSFQRAILDAEAAEDDDGGGGGRGRQPLKRRKRRRGGGINTVAQRLASCNPYKLWCTQALLEFHRNRSPPDKVIIFCDYLDDVRYYSQHLHLPFMDQRTSEAERANILQYFQFSDDVNAIILTRVGDVALDLPCASVIIQISGLGASRRQEAQRLGRILRPKPPSLDNTCSYFYTLVSQDTHEVRTSYERQSWLREQGFAYRVLHCEGVLSELARVGGVPCCIGPPRWWYQVSRRDNRESSGGGGHIAAAAAVEYAGGLWAPFSKEASARIQYFFVRGRDGCELDSQVLGSQTAWPTAEELGGVPLGAHEKWTVRLSSVDAPDTFGTVKIGESDESALNVRRIRFGELRRQHDCLQGPTTSSEGCISYALEQVCKRGVYSGNAYGASDVVELEDGEENGDYR